MLGDLGLNAFATEISLKNGPVRSEEDDVRNALDAVKLCRNGLGVDDLVPVHTVGLGGVNRCLRLIPNGNAEDIEIIADVLVLNLLDVRNLPLAWTTP